MACARVTLFLYTHALFRSFHQFSFTCHEAGNMEGKGEEMQTDCGKNSPQEQKEVATVGNFKRSPAPLSTRLHPRVQLEEKKAPWINLCCSLK